MTRHRHSSRSTVRDLRVPRLALRALLLAAAGALTALAIAFAAGDTGGGSAASATVVSANGSPNMRMVNNLSGSAILTATNMAPGGAPATGSVTISNDGTQSGAFTLTQSTPTGSTALAQALDLTIVDHANPGTPIYTGKLANFTQTAQLGTFGPGDQKTYDFTVSLPATVGNPLQRTTTSVEYTWSGPDTSGGGGTTSTATTPPPTDAGAGANSNPPNNNPTFTPSGGGNPTPPNVTFGGSTTQYTTDGYSLVLVCTQACTVGLGGTANVPGASKVYRLPIKYVSLRAGVRTTVKVKFPRKVAAAVRKAVSRNRQVTVRVALNIRNAAGASRNSSRTIFLKKQPRRH